MQIRNQKWVVKDKFIHIFLHQPYYGASARYGWAEEVEGIGIALEGIMKAKELNKKIRVVVGKYGIYEISADKALSVGVDYKFVARDKKMLYIIPRTAFKKVEPIVKSEPKDEREAYYQMMAKVHGR